MDHLGGNMENNKTQKAKETVIRAAISTWIIVVLAVLIYVFKNNPNGFELSLEELLGIVAVTTFLVGFSSVRLQSNLEYWKESIARQINQVLEQNTNNDLLPLPTNFSQYDTSKKEFKPRDLPSNLTVGLTWSTFVISSFLIYMHWRYGGQVAGVLLIQIIHLGIVLTGTLEPDFAKTIYDKYEKRQPFERYKKLSGALIDYLTTDEKNIEKTKKLVIDAVDALDDSLPSWCWLYLIRRDLGLNLAMTDYGPQLQRLREFAKEHKHFDDFSLIVFVWSSYLLYPNKASQLVRYSEIQRIMKFSNQTVIRAAGGGKTAHQLQICHGGDIYAEMALRCVYKAWNPPKAEANAPTNKSESAETDQSPLTVLENHLKKTRDNRLKVFIP